MLMLAAALRLFVAGCSSGASSAADAGDACQRLTAQYKAAVAAALTCTPGAPDQCQVRVATYPTDCPNFACGNEIWVNDKTDLEVARGKWLEACGGPPHSCPANTCVPGPPPSVCVAVGASVGTVGTSVGGHG